MATAGALMLSAWLMTFTKWYQTYGVDDTFVLQ